MNRFVLLIDMNWLVISRFSVIQAGFVKENPESVKLAAQADLRDFCAKSINVIINKFHYIDNIVIVADGGSWRKDVPVPSSLGKTIYKGNREEARDKQDFDWKYIWDALSQIVDQARSLGVTVSRAHGVEGDDWIYYWSRKLNSQGINCLIWSSDCDLKQLVQFDENTSAFTIWYNDKNGLCIPESMRDDSEDIDFFMKPQPDSMILEDLKRRSKSTTYINPDSIALHKFIMGDSGDNIMSIVKYKKGNRNYGVGNTDCEKVLNELGITTVQEFIDRREKVAEWFASKPKYKASGLSKEQILERIQYNIRMVWLNSKAMPKKILEAMGKVTYNNFDLSYIKTNYRCLVPEDTSEIERLFEGID